MTLSPDLEAILARVLAAPEPFHRAVATDADGTLWAVDVGDALFLEVAHRGRFGPVAAEQLLRQARELLGPGAPRSDPNAAAVELFARYEAGGIDVRVMCDLEAAAVADRAASDFDALVEHVAARGAQAVRPEVRTLLRSAREAGAVVHVVTGSLGCLVEATLRHADLPFDRVTGAELVRRDGWVHAQIAQTSPLFEGKTAALRAAGHWPAALGLGDGGWDHTFLRETHVPVLVHPKAALVAAMADVARAVVLGPAPPRN